MSQRVIKFTYIFQENNNFRKKSVFLTIEVEGMEMSCREGI